MLLVILFMILQGAEHRRTQTQVTQSCLSHVRFKGMSGH